MYALRNDALEPVDQLALSGGGGVQPKLWLDCYLFHEKNLAPTANDVALRFGERSRHVLAESPRAGRHVAAIGR